MPVTSRRFPGDVPSIEGDWETCKIGLLEFFQKIVDATSEGIPAGAATATSPTIINAGDTGTPGTEVSGWSPADHEHAVSTDVPVAIGSENLEGTSTSLSRADHVHASSFGSTTVETHNGDSVTFTYNPSLDSTLTEILFTLRELVDLELGS